MYGVKKHRITGKYCRLWYNAKFWWAPIGRNRSRDAMVSLLNGRLSVHSARFLAIFAQNLALYNKKIRLSSVSGPQMCDRFPRKFDFQTSYICCEHQISSGILSHDSAFDRRTLQ